MLDNLYFILFSIVTLWCTTLTLALARRSVFIVSKTEFFRGVKTPVEFLTEKKNKISQKYIC